MGIGPGGVEGIDATEPGIVEHEIEAWANDHIFVLKT